MNPLATKLNQTIESVNPAIFSSLSTIGKNIFFPKGILYQSAQAKEKAHKFNATIGIATENKTPMFLEEVDKYFSDLTPQEIYPYAPPAGRPKLRKLWQEKQVKENPTLQQKLTSLPVVTNALTNGLAVTADLFADPQDTLILPDQFWGNYRLLFVAKKQTNIATFSLFNEQKGFNTIAFKQTLEEQAKTKDKLIVLLNFPNNPTGYTPTVAEAKEICNIITNQAQKGTKLIVICDDAYSGLCFEDTLKESIFATLCDIHENVLAIKIDGATKEDFAWGFRIGFITFGCKKASADLYQALEAKVTGILRASISSCSHVAQSVFEKTLQSPQRAPQKQEKFTILKERALEAKRLLDSPKYKDALTYYPFNSGYFFCLKLTDIPAETLRQHLLDKYGVGTIASAEYDLRLAFSCIDKEDIDSLFSIIVQGIQDLQA